MSASARPLFERLGLAARSPSPGPPKVGGLDEKHYAPNGHFAAVSPVNLNERTNKHGAFSANKFSPSPRAGFTGIDPARLLRRVGSPSPAPAGRGVNVKKDDTNGTNGNSMLNASNSKRHLGASPSPRQSELIKYANASPVFKGQKGPCTFSKSDRGLGWEETVPVGGGVKGGEKKSGEEAGSGVPVPLPVAGQSPRPVGGLKKTQPRKVSDLGNNNAKTWLTAHLDVDACGGRLGPGSYDAKPTSLSTFK